MERFADWYVRRRGTVAVGVVICSLVFGFGLRRLDYDGRLRAVLKTNDADFAFLTSVFEDFGSDDNDCVLIVRAADLFTRNAIRAVRALTERVGALDGVLWVHGLANVPVFVEGQVPRPLLPAADAADEELAAAKRAALAHPLAAGELISEDATTTCVIARLAGGSLSAEQIRAVVRRMHAAAREVEAETGVDVYLTGIPPVRAEIFETVESEQYKFGTGGALASAIVVLLVFRRPAAAAITIFAALLGGTWALGAVGLFGQKINVLNNVLPTLVLVIAFTDAVHLMYAFRHARVRGGSAIEATREALRHVAGPCLVTSLTTAIGFASLGMARVEIIRTFGLIGAAGVALALIAVLATVPLLVSTRFGRRAAPRRLAADHSRLERAMAAIADGIVTHARTIAVVGLAVTLLLCVVALQLESDTQLAESIPARSDTSRALQLGDQAFGGLLVCYAVIEWEEPYTIETREVLSAIRDVRDVFAADPMTTHPLSVLELLAAMPPETQDPLDKAGMLSLAPEELRRRFVAPGAPRALVTAHVTDEGGRAYLPVYERIDRELAQIDERYERISIKLTGTPVIAARNVTQLIQDLALSLAFAALIIVVVMALAMRSVRLAVIGLIPNVFPLAVTATLLIVIGEPLRATSVVVFCVCLGIAVDDTIHFVSRFQQALARGSDAGGAVVHAFTVVGPAMLTTTAVFLAGFGVIALSEMPILRVFAGLSCVAFVAALLGDLVLLPALLVCGHRAVRG